MKTLALIPSFVLLLSAGCGGQTAGPTSRAVGGPCTSNKDCANTCVTANNTFPNGYCTVTCKTDAQCAAGSACVSDDFGPMCETLCSTVQNDCSKFGQKFACDEKARVEGPPSAQVCRSHL